MKAQEAQNGSDARNLTTHSTRAESAWMSFARLDASLNASRRVNSGVRNRQRLRHATVRDNLTSGMPQPESGLTTHSTRRLDSLSFIVLSRIGARMLLVGAG
jgi:hypothetical protein